jgi:quercetin dioxygenase-like cupin family protein
LFIWFKTVFLPGLHIFHRCYVQTAFTRGFDKAIVGKLKRADIDITDPKAVQAFAKNNPAQAKKLTDETFQLLSYPTQKKLRAMEQAPQSFETGTKFAFLPPPWPHSLSSFIECRYSQGSKAMKPRVMKADDGETKIAPADKFVGHVLQDQVFVPEGPSRMRATRVTFTPGGRTNWHTHAVGQVLYVLSGVGRYQLEGGPVHEILPGDTVVIPPKSRHWHGAAPDQMMCHLALSESDDQGAATEWLEAVSDTDYTTAPDG